MTVCAAETRGEDLRVDPFVLPARYATSLNGPAAIYLDREQAIVKRRLGGIPTTIACPVSTFRGVAVRMTASAETGAVKTIIELMHRDPALSLPLVVAEDLGDAEDVAADWQAWGRALGLPLLIIDSDGTVREPMNQLGSLAVGERTERRAPQPIQPRRPRFLKRRKSGFGDQFEILSGREIIARN